MGGLVLVIGVACAVLAAMLAPEGKKGSAAFWVFLLVIFASLIVSIFVPFFAIMYLILSILG
ncbi:MAG: hypothetical protein GDA40_01795 [Rhodobacteraceae bacterium]|nr:hypothetical protein [Paracoccaceae bacterium]